MTGGSAAERSESFLPFAESPDGTAGLIGQAAALGGRLEARPGGRLWADRPDLLPTARRWWRG